MTEPAATPATSSHDGAVTDRLDSWKEIAAYLRRDVTTAQRWEKREAMPVHRHLHDKLGSVYAFRAELDAWAATRKPQADIEDTPLAQPVASESAAAPSVSRRLFAVSLLTAAALASAAALTVWRLQASDYFWRNPLANARFQRLTDFEGTEHSAAISRDGKLVAFESSRDGHIDVWITQVGTGQFRNLTDGRMPELANRSLRALGFSPDAAIVSFWAGKSDASNRREIAVWAAPTLGGEPHLFLEGIAEVDWSRDGHRMVYHTPAAGDPTFVKTDDGPAQSIFVAPAGQHSHFQTWSPDGAFIYFVQGNLPDEMDIWRMTPTGGAPERITFQNSRVSHPIFVDRSTLLYLAADKDDPAPRIYALDLQRRIPHRLSNGVDGYTSLAASADGRRLVATADNPRTSLWRVPLSDQPAQSASAQKIALPNTQGRSPRLAVHYLLYVASNAASDGIWKLANGAATELWTAWSARIVGGPAIAPDEDRIAFLIEDQGKRRLVVMNADGTGARTVGDALDFRGAPAWSPDALSIVTAVNDGGKPRLFRIVVNTGAATRVVDDYARDPAWSPTGGFLVYSGMDIGTTFPLKSITDTGQPYHIPDLTLIRGARRFRFLPGQDTLIVLRGDIEHKNLWAVDLRSGAERQLTNFDRSVLVEDFDVSPDGRELVFERAQENSDVVLIDLAPR